MTRNELTDMILDTKKALSFYENIKPDCNTCESLLRDNKCKTHDSVVPEDFLTTGCDQWSFDEVPF